MPCRLPGGRPTRCGGVLADAAPGALEIGEMGARLTQGLPSSRGRSASTARASGPSGPPRPHHLAFEQPVGTLEELAARRCGRTVGRATPVER